jgi:hypothetical protein
MTSYVEEKNEKSGNCKYIHMLYLQIKYKYRAFKKFLYKKNTIYKNIFR